MENIFKLGDKVFDVRYGWGEVYAALDSDTWPVLVDFGNNLHEEYTLDGRAYDEFPRVLSFTEYTLEGFSQDRPEELPNIGDIVWVREYGSVDWRVSHFFGKSGDKYLASIFGIKELACTWTEMTTKNPHTNEQ